MTLRRASRAGEAKPMRPPTPWIQSIPLRSRVTLLAAGAVAVAVAMTSIAAYAVVARAMYADVDKQLESRVAAVASNVGYVAYNPQFITGGARYTSDVSVALLYPNLAVYIPPGSNVPIGGAEQAVATGHLDSSLRTTNGQRVLARRIPDGNTVVIAQRLQPTADVLRRMASVLFVVGGCGVVLAALTGATVGRTALRPVARLTAAAERVARTDDLRPIRVTGHDELARLTEAFNMMLRAVGESRERQSRLVADAGHELRTPLTSLRTNLELLIAASRPGAPSLPEADMADLRQDVVAQIEELSTLVGDLVDLARDDAPETVFEPVDIADVVDRTLERVRRRRSDVTFDVVTQPWFVFGDQSMLSRAVLNVLDNAVKWSPDAGTVRVRMDSTSENLLTLTVDDAGPGIPEQDRQLVFERFYRSTEDRAMPGSGLGLAIVRQAVTKHGGTIAVDDSPLGGARIRIVLPGTASLAA